MRNSGVDDPRFLATTINTWMKGWRSGSQPVRSYAEAAPIKLTAGEYGFTKHCAACHTIGGGDRIGPDLIGVTSSRTTPWLMRFILEPDVVRAEKDPIATTLSAKFKPAVMPRLGLARADIEQIVSYLRQRSPAAEVKSASPLSPSAIATIVDPYLQIQRALNLDSIDGIADRAREIAKAAAAAGASAEAIRAAAVAINATSLDKARAGFAQLSDAVIAVVDQTGTTVAADVQLAYCPMLQKHWLQRGAQIQNPFYGKQMSECGRVVTASRGR
jgi:mono/diheme cytochrome c family protein